MLGVALASLLFSAGGLLSCKAAEEPNSLASYRSKSYPEFSIRVFRDPSGTDETSLLYYFHGSGGDTNTWPKANRGVIAGWTKPGVRAPVVVAVTCGPDWLMFPEEVSSRSVHLGVFVNNLMPEIERELGGRIERRLLYGYSIGGANVAQLVFRYPELFERAVIASPQIYPFPIYASNREINDFIASVETSVHLQGFLDMIKRKIFMHDSVAASVQRELSEIRWNVKDAASWAKADIFANMHAPPGGGETQVYISCGKQDTNGFFPGAEKLAQVAASRGYSVKFDALEGGHMALDEPFIAGFLAGRAR